MTLESPGLIAIAPTPRALNAPWPMGPCQVLPPSVDLYRPTPAAQPLPQPFPSPVPTQIVLPDGSFGSRVIEPIALMSNAPLWNSQFGWPVSAFFVRQMPPPAGATHMRQFPGWQVGAIATSLI